MQLCISNFFSKKLLGVAVCAAVASAPVALFAQEISNETVERKRQEKKDTAESLEEVTVTGIRRQLESALEIKRNANSIVDHISADDISGFPALDLGETLQAIPGVQVSREAERRQSSISLRGLPGGFVKSTVNGHDFANPTRSFSPTSQSPFGAFESSVFRGITVVKTPTADLIEGGIAGVVDKKLPNALKGKTELKVNVGARFEELNDSVDPELSFSGRYKFNDDFAVAGSLAASAQRFRRDSFNFNRYVQFDNVRFPEFDDFKTRNGIPQDARVFYPGEIRQFSEINDGNRVSFSGNMGWQVNDALKLSTDVLYTRRNLDDNSLEIVDFRARGNSQRFRVAADEARAKPFVAGTDGQGEEVWVQPAITWENPQFSTGNRIFHFNEQTAGAFFNADWEQDAWQIDATLGYSEAKNDFVQAAIATTIPMQRLDLGRTNGLTGHLYTGEGDPGRFSFALDDFTLAPESDAIYNRFDLDQDWVASGRGIWDTNQNSVQTAHPGFGGDGRNNLRLSTVGNVQNADRDLSTGDVNFTYNVEGDTIQRIKFGVKKARETVSHLWRDQSIAGVDLDAIDNSIAAEPFYRGSTDYFGGNAPGFLGYENGWLSYDLHGGLSRLQNGLQARVVNGLDQALAEGRLSLEDYNKRQSELELVEESGFYRRPGRLLDRISSATLNSTAVYAMLDFDQELANIYFSGNFGVRYVDTQQDAIGNSLDFNIVQTNTEDDGMVEINAGRETFNTTAGSTTKYHHVLPSFNISADLTDEVKMRFAAYRGMVRPNLRFSKPSRSIKINGDLDKINIDLPQSDLGPYTANSFDFSTSWYNRKGSVISLGLYRKDLSGGFTKVRICPSNGREYNINSTISRVDSELECIVDDAAAVLSARSVATDDNPLPIEFGEDDIDLAAGDQLEIDIRKTVNSSEVQQIKGVEFSVQQNLDFLPAPWDGFGGIINYSNVKVDGEQVLTGVSENSYNLIGYYENDLFNLRLSYNYRDKYFLAGGGSFQGTDQREVKPRGQLDLSLSVRPMKQLRLVFRGYNLTDEIYEEFQFGNPSMNKRTNYDGRIYSFAASYRF